MRLSTKREQERVQTREREREREQELYYFVIGVVHHLDCNQGAPRYLYKNVVVCMKDRKDLENAWKLLVINLQYNKLKLIQHNNAQMECSSIGKVAQCWETCPLG